MKKGRHAAFTGDGKLQDPIQGIQSQVGIALVICVCIRVSWTNF